jgi:hypothetical protein
MNSQKTQSTSQGASIRSNAQEKNTTSSVSIAFYWNPLGLARRKKNEMGAISVASLKSSAKSCQGDVESKRGIESFLTFGKDLFGDAVRTQ